jgi:hypothetical protein
MKPNDAIKLFGLNNLSIEAEVRRVEREYSIDFGHSYYNVETADQSYYPQFAERLRSEAERMAVHYAVFYCLENSIRMLVSQRLEEENGNNWWEVSVPDFVRVSAKKNRDKEMQAGVTPRSTDLIDFITFGELGEIIKVNWVIFGDTFRDIKAVEKVLASLNTLRGPIAHCKELAPDEVLRLKLSLSDWFRQME